MLVSLLAFFAGLNDRQLHEQMHSIQLTAAEYGDLAPIGRAIGSATVVQLGETTHGDGTGFALKDRICRYLHERLGFDVLIWESSFLQCGELDRELAGSESIGRAASSAVFPHWTSAKESIGIFEHARRSRRTKRPLQMAGFDIQPSGWASTGMFVRLVKRVADLGYSSVLTHKVAEISRMRTDEERDQGALQLSAACAKVVEVNFQAVVQQRGPIAAEELRLQVRSMVGYQEMMESFQRYQSNPTGDEFQLGYNLREKLNAEILLWQIRTKFKGKKVMVWAHNAHISKNGGAGDFDLRQPGEVCLDSTGRFVAETLGGKNYSLGFVAGTGSWSWLGGKPIPFAPASAGSLEAMLGKGGEALGFINLRTARTEFKAVNAPLPGYVSRQGGVLSNVVWPKVFDGLIYIREMQPRTQIRE